MVMYSFYYEKIELLRPFMELMCTANTVVGGLYDGAKLCHKMVLTVLFNIVSSNKGLKCTLWWLWLSLVWFFQLVWKRSVAFKQTIEKGCTSLI